MTFAHKGKDSALYSRFSTAMHSAQHTMGNSVRLVFVVNLNDETERRGTGILKSKKGNMTNQIWLLIEQSTALYCKGPPCAGAGNWALRTIQPVPSWRIA